MDRTPLTVASVESVGPDSIAVAFETPSSFSARPGQFVKLTLDTEDGEQSRFYTISSPDVADTFEVTVGIDPNGAVAPLLADLEPGDSVPVAGPFGDAYYEGETDVVVLAGGPGVGPAVGIGERAVAADHAAAIVYRDDDPIHRDRLERLSESGAFVRIVDEERDLTDPTAAALEAVGGDAQAFVYGFADFLDVAMDALESAGGDAEAAKVENFG
ncbi:Flavodoxin reductase (ferredoxin-NADPH reductase) family 1 [Halapricum desulfuricans]|uniref:Flavodoxin reductase (Ferredoxin-NADPH reductase) family 1 n=1 Tax=Halapricum desulfuricans TaxID=2841257 RepID=A0A897NIQ5_9EURY|nr:FAD-dependent oxidoreductase [Halapricum desulfuricans]QSG10843.1 Flavodoxin reductase (ferredoxin-NADPH reductase) family 1 [Halapricum desulfuricans]